MGREIKGSLSNHLLRLRTGAYLRFRCWPKGNAHRYRGEAGQGKHRTTPPPTQSKSQMSPFEVAARILLALVAVVGVVAGVFWMVMPKGRK